MNMFLYWTGVAFWFSVVSVVTWIVVVEILIVGVSNSISKHRWLLSQPESKFRWRKHGWKLIRSVCAGVVEYAGYRNNGMSRLYTDKGGEWKGIGDWTPIPGEREKGEPS